MAEADRHVLARWLFLRSLGLILLSAFASIGAQIEGLLGSRGILPAAPYLARIAESMPGIERCYRIPSLFWLDASDASLVGLCTLGGAASLGLILNLWPRGQLAFCWLAYLSISSVGRTFLSFQWDTLLLEVTLAGLLLAPPGWRPGFSAGWASPRFAVLGVRVLLFKLMFMSGWAKLSSGDPNWTGLTALLYHYETQPLPTWLGWWAHQLPGWFQSLSVLIMFAIQLLVPFASFAPARLRAWAFYPLAGLQLLIALTGNYGFFNFLALALTLWLLDDAHSLARLPAPVAALYARLPAPTRARGYVQNAAAILMILLSALTIADRVLGPLPEQVDALFDLVRPLRSVNGYGLFAVMTTTRDEIEIEGSQDGVSWSSYLFYDKPGPLERAPSFVAPHMPRLDWQMWFAALSDYRRNPWLPALLQRLLEGSPPVLALFERDPFAGTHPRYVRARTFRYHFSSIAERRQSGAWWKREETGMYFPAFSLSGRLEAP